jgi:hypothetical protein
VPCKYNGAYKKEITKMFTEKILKVAYKREEFHPKQKSDPIKAVCTKIVA